MKTKMKTKTKQLLFLITYHLLLIAFPAHAEKLCLVAPASYTYRGNSITNPEYDASGNSGGNQYYGWAVGEGCGNAHKSSSGALSGFCTTTQAYGIAACAVSTANPNYGSVAHDNTNGDLCFCKMTSPKTGVWVVLGRYLNGASYCRTSCANDCANYVRVNATFRAAVLASGS